MPTSINILNTIDWAELRGQQNWLATQPASPEKEGIARLLQQLQHCARLAGQGQEQVYGPAVEPEPENEPCRLCGDTETPLHYTRICGNCGLATPTEAGRANRWKLTNAEDADDVIGYITDEAKARRVYGEYDRAGGYVRLFSCHEDPEGELTEWESEACNRAEAGEESDWIPDYPQTAEAAAPAGPPVAEPVRPAGLGESALVLVSSQRVTLADTAFQMKAGPRKAKALFAELQQNWNGQATFLHLALFSGETNLEAMIGRLMAERKRQAGGS